MKKNYQKNYKENKKKKQIYLENLRMLLLNFNLMYTTHKILVLLKNHLNNFKDGIFECFFKECKRLLFFF